MPQVSTLSPKVYTTFFSQTLGTLFSLKVVCSLRKQKNTLVELFVFIISLVLECLVYLFIFI